jgi:hypothetical protein
MPNGKPGDHPLTDIVVHNIEVFGSEIYDKVRRIHAASPPAVQGHLDALLYWWPTQNPNDANSPILNSKGMSYVLDALLEYVRRHDVEGFGLEIDDKVQRFTQCRLRRFEGIWMLFFICGQRRIPTTILGQF